jgi:OOP family OmpA-OmpF porin
MKKLALLVTIAFGLFPLAVYSQGYMAVTAGQSDIDIPFLDDSYAWSVQAGYRLGDYFAFEAGYSDLGDWDVSGPGGAAVLEGYGFDLALLAILPITERFELFGRVGYAHWEADFVAAGPALPGVIALSESGEDGTYGGGIAFNVTPQWNLSLGFQRYDADGVDIDYAYVGSKYYFGSRSTTKSAPSQPTYQQQAAATYDPVVPQLRAKSASDKDACQFITTISTGAGGPGDPSTHTQKAMDKALTQAAATGADSYYLVDADATATGASVVLEALKCN